MKLPSEHFLYQLRILAALQLKKPGEVYAGTAKGRHRKTESAPARRRRRHKAAVAKRSETVRRRHAYADWSYAAGDPRVTE